MGIQMNRYSSMLTNWHRMIEEYLRDLQRNTRKSLIILMDIQKVLKAVITNASNMKKFSVFGTSESIANINKTEK
ncbi:MAG: hypothetical protein ACLR7D_07360 [Lachnospira eligens]